MYAEIFKYYQTINYTYDYANNYTYDYAKIFCMMFLATLKWKKQQFFFPRYTEMPCQRGGQNSFKYKDFVDR